MEFLEDMLRTNSFFDHFSAKTKDIQECLSLLFESFKRIIRDEKNLMIYKTIHLGPQKFNELIHNKVKCILNDNPKIICRSNYFT